MPSVSLAPVAVHGRTGPAEIQISDGFVTSVVGVAPGPENPDSVFPGLIDLQVNGGWGRDFTSDPETIWEVGNLLPTTGVTAFLPTIVSSPPAAVDAAIEVVAAGPPTGYRGAAALGVHLEGPWISPRRSGAHEHRHLTTPDPALARRWAASGVVRMVTMAPELDHAFETAAILAREGVVVSLGHTSADYETARKALAGPWGCVTHLFNAMTGTEGEPGAVDAALHSGRPCGVIVDGVHVSEPRMRRAWSELGPNRLMLVTDATAVMGRRDGRYTLGDIVVERHGTGPPLLPSGRPAGSSLTMDRAVANLVSSTSATWDQAVECAAAVPAGVVGDPARGVIRPGARADLVFFDTKARLTRTIVGGATVYEA